jgi:hypothetical protein
MWEIFGRIFASPKSIEKTMDAVVSAGDKLWLTKEERMENQNILNEWYLRYLEATQPQAISRRVLTFIISFMWAVVLLAAIIVGVVTGEYGSVDILVAGPDSVPPNTHANASGFLFAILVHAITRPFTAVVIFYFGGHYLTEALRKFKDSSGK